MRPREPGWGKLMRLTHLCGNSTYMEHIGVSGGQRRPKNFITPWVLLVLKQWSLHGYMNLQQLNRMGFSGIDHATLYRELRRLESQGFVASEWETGESGPARRVYKNHRRRRGNAAGMDRSGIGIPAHDHRLLRPLCLGVRVRAALGDGGTPPS